MTERHSGPGAIAVRRASGPAMTLIALLGALLLVMYAISGPTLAQTASPSPTTDPTATQPATTDAAPTAPTATQPDTALEMPGSSTPGKPNMLLVIAAIGAVAVMLLLFRPLGRRAESDVSLPDDD